MLRVQLVRALDEIREAPNLTDAGHRLIGGIDGAMDQLLNEHIPRPVQLTAERALAATEARWRATR
jgi:hypothetical protein